MQNGSVEYRHESRVEPFPCHKCGESLRLVYTTGHELIVINADPDPQGNIVPWPPDDCIGLSAARFVEVRPSDQEVWSQHRCG